MNNEEKNENDSLSDALSALGWVEEKEKEEALPESTTELEERVRYLMEKNKQLEEDIVVLRNEAENFKAKFEDVENTEIVKDLKSKNEDLMREAIENLKEDFKALSDEKAGLDEEYKKKKKLGEVFLAKGDIQKYISNKIKKNKKNIMDLEEKDENNENTLQRSCVLQ